MPRKKRTSTTEKTSTKNDTKTPAVSRSKSRSVKPKKTSTKTRNTSKTPRAKSTVKRGRPAGKSKAAVAVQDRSRESSVSSASPEKPKKNSKKSSSNIEKSASKSKKEEVEKVEKVKGTRASAKSKSKGRPLSKSKASKSSSKQAKAKEEAKTRSSRKGRKAEKKDEKSSSPEEEVVKAVLNTPKRKKQVKEPKSQAVEATTPGTERVRTRVKGVVCKKEDIEEKEDKKGKSKKKEKEQKAIPSRAQAKLFKKKLKKEEKDLPRFPTTEATIEGLIVEAIKGLKTKAMEDRIIGYLGKRFSDVDGDNIKSVLERMQIDEKLLLKGLSGKQVKCGKREPDRPEGESLEGTPKKVKTSRNSSPIGRFETKNMSTHMEVETNKGDGNVGMEEEKTADVVIKEEADKKLEESPIVIPEEKEIVLSLNDADSKKALIEYYERKLLKIKGLLTDKKERKSEQVRKQSSSLMQDQDRVIEQVMQRQGEAETQGQPEEPKREEQEEQTRQCVVSRFEAEDIGNEKRNLSFEKEGPVNVNNGGQGQSQEEKGKERYMESEEKIEEDEGRGMVIWEIQESSEIEKNLSAEGMKEAGQENRIEQLMKLLTMSGVVQPEGGDEQKIEDLQPQRVEEEKKVEESVEKIEETTENKDGRQEENSTKTEPKLEEQEQKTEEGAQNVKARNGEEENREMIRKKMRSAVESYLEMLQGRVEVDYNGDNVLSTSEEGHQEKDLSKEKQGEEKALQDKEARKEEENNVKEESDQEKPQKLSVSKFFS